MVTHAQISQYERGTRNPKVETLRRIADALDVTVEHLLGEDDTDREFKAYARRLGARIYSTRMDKGISDEEMVSKTRFHPGRLTAIEIGNFPSDEELKKICDAFGVSQRDLLWDGSPIAVEFLEIMGVPAPLDRTGQTQSFEPITALDKELLKHGFAPFFDFHSLTDEGKARAMADINGFIEYTIAKYQKKPPTEDTPDGQA